MCNVNVNAIYNVFKYFFKIVEINLYVKVITLLDKTNKFNLIIIMCFKFDSQLVLFFLLKQIIT